MVRAARELTPINVLVAVPNYRDFTALEEHLRTDSANIISVGGVLASVPDMGNLFMHHANEPSTFYALHPIDL